MDGQVPTGVKIIAVLFFISAFFSLIGGIFAFSGSGLIPLASIPGAGFLASFFLILGIVLIALGVLDFFVGFGLWKGRNWARVVAIILAILGFLLAIISIILGSYSSIVSLIITGFIGYYLWFNAGVKQAFVKQAFA